MVSGGLEELAARELILQAGKGEQLQVTGYCYQKLQ